MIKLKTKIYRNFLKIYYGWTRRIAKSNDSWITRKLCYPNYKIILFLTFQGADISSWNWRLLGSLLIEVTFPKDLKPDVSSLPPVKPTFSTSIVTQQTKESTVSNNTKKSSSELQLFKRTVAVEIDAEIRMVSPKVGNDKTGMVETTFFDKIYVMQIHFKPIYAVLSNTNLLMRLKL